MENLTQKQNEIISNLVAEFTKINDSHCVKLSSNPLLNIANDFDSAKNKELIDRASIDARNRAKIRENQAQCEEDAYELKLLLDELNKGLSVKVTHSNTYSSITIKTESWFGPSIYYSLPIEGCEKYTYLDGINILGCTKITDCNGRVYHDYLEVLHDDGFRAKFIELLNR